MAHDGTGLDGVSLHLPEKTIYLFKRPPITTQNPPSCPRVAGRQEPRSQHGGHGGLRANLERPCAGGAREREGEKERAGRFAVEAPLFLGFQRETKALAQWSPFGLFLGKVPL